MSNKQKQKANLSFWLVQNLPYDNAGQALIEVLAALAIAMVVLTALSVAAITSVRNASFAKNQSLANDYARQAMESLRAYRDLNPTTFFGKADNICYGINKTTLLTDPNSFTAATNATIWPCSTRNNNPDSNENLGNGFTQQIALGPTAQASPCPVPTGVTAGCKTVTVYVFWRDASGTHQSNLTTYFGAWQ